MSQISLIVEGEGEVEAAAGLLRRILSEQGHFEYTIMRPKNSHGKGNLTKAGGIERFIKYSELEPKCCGIIVMLDSDHECPVVLARSLSLRISTLGHTLPTAIVVAERAFESWIVASVETMIADFGFAPHTVAPVDSDAIGNPKAWIDSMLPAGVSYKETIDQVKMAHRIDFELASGRSRSFRRLTNATNQIVQADVNNVLLLSPT